MEESTAGYVSTILDLGGTLGAILTGVASDTLYSGASLHTAMHMCAATGFAFVFWAGACFIGATTLVHVLSIALIGFFIAGPGGVLGAAARGLVEAQFTWPIMGAQLAAIVERLVTAQPDVARPGHSARGAL